MRHLRAPRMLRPTHFSRICYVVAELIVAACFIHSCQGCLYSIACFFSYAPIMMRRSLVLSFSLVGLYPHICPSASNRGRAAMYPCGLLSTIASISIMPIYGRILRSSPFLCGFLTPALFHLYFLDYAEPLRALLLRHACGRLRPGSHFRSSGSTRHSGRLR